MLPENYNAAMAANDYLSFSSQIEKGCTRCSLSEHDNHPVLWRGNIKSKILLLGESPGLEEDRQSLPFVGPAGELLDKIFWAIGMKTNKDLFITNCAYCRPVAPKDSGRQNYTPVRSQLVQCFPFVKKTIELIDPKIIIACGRTALSMLTNDPGIKITPWEGKWLKYENRDMFVMTHPAALIHKQAKAPYEDYIAAKKKVWQYIQYFRDTYKEKLE